MKKIYAVCNGIFGLNIYTVVNEINKSCLDIGKEPLYHFEGFICDDPRWLNRFGLSDLYVGPLSTWPLPENAAIGLGVDNPIEKEATVKEIKRFGLTIETLISPIAILPLELKVGKGSLITAKTSIKDTAIIHDYVSVVGAMIGSYAEINEYSTLRPLTNITNAKIGKGTLVGRNVTIPYTNGGIKVGEYAVITAGSVVIRNVRDGSVVTGNPAKRVRIHI